MKILKDKKGTTLVELIVGMVIFAIIVTSTVSLLVPMLNSFNKARDLAEYNTLLDNLSNQLTSDLSRANLINVNYENIIISTTDYYNFYYTVADGILHRDGTPLIDKNYYKGKTIKVEYFDKDLNVATNLSKSFIVRLTLLDGATSLMKKDYAVLPLALNQYN